MASCFIQTHEMLSSFLKKFNKGFSLCGLCLGEDTSSFF